MASAFSWLQIASFFFTFFLSQPLITRSQTYGTGGKFESSFYAT